jgi:DNA repair ATPase RecN
MNNMFPLLPFFSVWPYTPAIPAFYWNAKSQEEIIKHIACEIDHITAYLDEIVTDINKTLNDYDTRIKNIETNINDYAVAITQIQEQIDHIGNTQLIWNVTKGEYTDSKTAMRDLYRELAVYGARISQIADINIGKLAEHRTDETPAVGNLTIFNDNTPRVTDTKTGKPYPSL